MYLVRTIGFLLLFATSHSSNQEVEVQRLRELILRQRDEIRELSRKIKEFQEIRLQKELVGQYAKRSIGCGKTAKAFSVRVARIMGPSSVVRTIRFNEILLNLGGGYNPSSGVFVVPVTGIYLFTVSMRAGHDVKGGSVHLMKNDKVLAYVHDNYAGGNSNQVIVRAMKGDHVFARLMPSFSLCGIEATTNMNGILLIPG